MKNVLRAVAYLLGPFIILTMAEAQAPPFTLSPGLAAVGSGNLPININGSNFTANSVVRWNGTDLPTVFHSSFQLTATVPSADFSLPDLVPITVFDPANGETTPVYFPVYINLTANDLIYRSADQKFYVTLPSSFVSGNSVAPLDPGTGVLGTPVFVGSEPRRMAISDDGQFLYIGLRGAPDVRRFNLVTQSADIMFPVGSDSFFGPKYPGEMAVLPGNPNAVAVSLVYPNVSPKFAGLGIWDDSTERPNAIGQFSGTGNLVDSIAFGSTSANLYGYNNDDTGFDFYRMAVNASGVSITDHEGSLISGFFTEIKFDHGFIYSTSGGVIDPTVPAVVGTFIPDTNYSFNDFVPDSAHGRAFYMATNFNSATRLYAFNQNTFTQQAHLDITGISGVSSMLRWGSDGIAFRAVDNLGSTIGVVTFHSKLVQAPVKPAITAASPNPLPINAGLISLTIQGSNFIPGSLVRWNGANRTTHYVSATQLSLDLLPSDTAALGTASVTVYNPPAGGSLSDPFSIPITNVVYTLAVQPPTVVTAFAGQTGTFTTVLTALNGYASNVTLSCVANLTAPPANCVGGTFLPTVLGVTAAVQASDTVAKDYFFYIQGVGADAASLTRQQAVSLRVVDFQLSAPPASITMVNGAVSPTIALQLTPLGKINSSITLSCTGLPAGATCNFSPATINISNAPVNVGLVIATTTGVAASTYPINIVATNASPSGSHSQPLSLIVNQGTAVTDLSVSLNNAHAPRAIAVGRPTTFTATVSNLGTADAGNVSVSIAFSGRVQVVSASDSCSGTGPVTCNLSTVAQGTNTSVSVTVVPGSLRSLTVTALVTTTASDSNTSNNTDTSVVRVRLLPLTIR